MTRSTFDSQRILQEAFDETNGALMVNAASAFEGRWPSGSYLISPEGGSYSGVGVTLDRVFYAPIWVPEARTISEFAIETTVAAAATGVIRLGLYAPAANGRPGALLADFGTVASDATAGVQSKTGLSTAVTRGLYWGAFVGQVTVTSLVVRHIFCAANRFVNKTTMSTTTMGGPYLQESVTGALPATATPTLTSNISLLTLPIMFPKAA